MASLSGTPAYYVQCIIIKTTKLNNFCYNRKTVIGVQWQNYRKSIFTRGLNIKRATKIKTTQFCNRKFYIKRYSRFFLKAEMHCILHVIEQI